VLPAQLVPAELCTTTSQPWSWMSSSIASSIEGWSYSIVNARYGTCATSQLLPPAAVHHPLPARQHGSTPVWEHVLPRSARPIRLRRPFRPLVMEALERAEVAARPALANHISTTYDAP